MAIEIWTLEDLQKVRDNPAGDFMQMADIDCGGVDWIPIGADSYFAGHYNGQGFSILNLDNVFFEAIQESAVVEGVNLKGSLVGVAETLYSGGMLAIYNGGNVRGCSCEGQVRAESAGGLVCYNEGYIEQCYIDAIVQGQHVGGFVCYNISYVENCYVRGFVEGVGGSASYWLGDFCRDNYGSVLNCYSVAKITADYNLYYCGLPYSAGGYHGGFFINIDAGCVHTKQIPGVPYYPVDGMGGNHPPQLVRAGNGRDILKCSYYNGVDDIGWGVWNEPLINRSTAQMKEQGNYIGYDFLTVWDIDPNKNDGYPYLRALEVAEPPAPMPEIIRDAETDVTYVDWSKAGAEVGEDAQEYVQLIWDYYRVKLYKIGYTEVAVPEGEPPAETVIGYTEVFSKTVNKWHKNKIPANDPDRLEMRVDATPAILKHGEGDYVATLQGLVYADLTADEINSLGAVAPLEETRASSEPSEYSEIYEEIYYAPPVPILDDKNDKWTVSWDWKTLKDAGYKYMRVKLYRADLPPGSIPLGPQETPPPEYIPPEVPTEPTEPVETVWTEIYRSRALPNQSNSNWGTPHNVTEHVTKQEPGIYYATVQGLAFRNLTGAEKYEFTGKPEYQNPDYVSHEIWPDYQRPTAVAESEAVTETIIKSDAPNLYVDQDPVTKETKWLIDWGVPDTVHNYVVLRLYWAATPTNPATVLKPTDFTEVYKSKAITNGVGHAPFDVTEHVWDKGTGIYVATAQGIGSRDEFGIEKEYGTSSILPWIGTDSYIKPEGYEANPMDGRRTSVESDFSGEVEAIPQTLVYDSVTLLTDYMTSNHYDLIFAIEGLSPSADPNAVGNIPPRCNFRIDRINKSGQVIESQMTDNVGNNISYSYDQVKWMATYYPGRPYRGIYHNRFESSIGAVFLKVPIEAGAVDDFDIKLSIKAGGIDRF